MLGTEERTQVVNHHSPLRYVPLIASSQLMVKTKFSLPLLSPGGHMESDLAQVGGGANSC